MSKVKKKVDRRSATVLLTEVLPYETPLFFSNNGFFQYTISNTDNQPTLLKKLFTQRRFYLPYNYDVKRSEFKYRNLSIMHPIVQLDFCAFYSEFENIILDACNRSKFSLRKPLKKTKYVFLDSNDNSSPIIPSKYYKYGPYSFIYSFFSSSEFNRLEKRFKSLLQIDISKCFPNIYTHSISWALKNKKFAKENINKYSFEERFDTLMQNSNYNETNGIIIGPEISRIFAEIILQKIDFLVEKRLLEKGYQYGVSYKVKRYVDDFYIFSNDKNTLDTILELYEEELSHYKLHINESKTSYKQSPFISEISVAKINISYTLNQFFNIFSKTFQNGKKILDAEKLKKINRTISISMKGINQIKSIIKNNSCPISKISRYTLSIIENKLIECFNFNKNIILNDAQESNILSFITVVLDLIFYIIPLDTVTKNTHSLIYIITLIRKFFIQNNLNDLKVIEKRIYDELLLLHNSFIHKSKDTSVEAINILVALKTLSKDFTLTQKQLNGMFNLEINSNKILEINYFKFVGILYYIGEKPEYTKIRLKLCEGLIKGYKKEESPMSQSDLFCLFFDTLKCRGIDLDTKKTLIDIVAQKEDSSKLNDSQKNQVINFIKKYNWFIEWNAHTDTLLKQKKLQLDY